MSKKYRSQRQIVMKRK